MSDFQKELYAGLKRRLNAGPLRNAAEQPAGKGEKPFFEKKKTWPPPGTAPAMEDFLREHGAVVEKHIANKKELFGLLRDPASKRILLDTTLYTLLGSSFVEFANYEELKVLRYKLKRAAQFGTETIVLRETIRDKDLVALFSLTLNSYDLSGIDPLKKYKVYTMLDTVVSIYNNKLYEFTGGRVSIKAEKGDYVMDCGGCIGDTATSFAYAVKPKGRVFSFEPYPKFIEVMRMNVKLNPFLENIVTIIPRAASKHKDLQLKFLQCSEGSTYCEDKHLPDADYITVQTTTIDSEVAERRLPRVDFIKMDIEGAELDALQGARQTLESFRPKLAISIYHRLEDYSAIPAYLKELNLGYAFYLGHQSHSDADVILFAAPDADKDQESTD